MKIQYTLMLCLVLYLLYLPFQTMVKHEQTLLPEEGLKDGEIRAEEMFASETMPAVSNDKKPESVQKSDEVSAEHLKNRDLPDPQLARDTRAALKGMVSSMIAQKKYVPARLKNGNKSIEAIK